MQTGEYKHKQTKRFPLALITVQLGEFMVGMHFNTLLCLSVEIVNITLCHAGSCNFLWFKKCCVQMISNSAKTGKWSEVIDIEPSVNTLYIVIYWLSTYQAKYILTQCVLIWK